MNKKLFITTIVLVLLILAPAIKVYSWWDVGHRALVSRAIEFLPDKWKEFFQYYQYFLEETSVWPDTILARKAGESYNHYYDSEYPLEAHIKNPEKGRLPWRVEELMNQLTESIEQKDWYKVLETAGLLSHYLADSAQPYHTTADYNPPITSNISAPGVKPKHAVVESTHAQHIEEIIPKNLNITPTYIEDPFKFMFEFMNESNSFLDELNSIVLGKDIKDPSDDRDWPELKPLLVNRSIRAIWLISSMWYTAILDADAIDSAPDPTQFTELSLDVKGVKVPQLLGNIFITMNVRDKIGVPVVPDTITMKFGEDSIKLRNIDLGEYSGTISADILEKYSGKSVTLEIKVDKEGYTSFQYTKSLEIPLYKEVEEPKGLPVSFNYIAIALIGMVIVVGAVFLLKRKG